jgi:hypothetical protein
MKDDRDKRERQTGTPTKNPRGDPRQDRLKLALRENLKRRKSQAKGRGDAARASRSDVAGASSNGDVVRAPSNEDVASPYGGNAKKPGE